MKQQWSEEAQQATRERIESPSYGDGMPKVALFGGSDIETDMLLTHPNYCAFPKYYERCKLEYIELLSTYVRLYA